MPLYICECLNTNQHLGNYKRHINTKTSSAEKLISKNEIMVMSTNEHNEHK